MDAPPRPLAHFTQGFQKAAAIRVVLEDRLPPVAPVVHMINRPCKFNARFASHEIVLTSPAKSEILAATPFPFHLSTFSMNAEDWKAWLDYADVWLPPGGK